MTKLERLTRYLLASREERERYERMGKEEREDLAVILESPSRRKLPFWCVSCRRDVEAVGDKDFCRPSVPFARYVAKCPKGHRMTRYIVRKHADPFFRLSRLLRQQRAMMERDLLQPGDPRFARLYGDPILARERKLEERRRQEFNASYKGYGVA